MCDVERQQRTDANLLAQMSQVVCGRPSYWDWSPTDQSEEIYLRDGLNFFKKIGLIGQYNIRKGQPLTIEAVVQSNIRKATASIQEAVVLRFFHLAKDENRNQKLNAAALGNSLTQDRMKVLVNAAKDAGLLCGTHFTDGEFHMKITQDGCLRFDSLLEQKSAVLAEGAQQISIQSVGNLQFGSNNVIAAHSARQSIPSILNKLRQEVRASELSANDARRIEGLLDELGAFFDPN